VGGKRSFRGEGRMASAPSGITDPSWMGERGAGLSSEIWLFSVIAAPVTTMRASSRQHFAAPILASALQ